MAIVWGASWLDENISRWELSGWEFSWVGIVQAGLILGGTFLWWKFSWWKSSEWQFTGWEFLCYRKLQHQILWERYTMKFLSEYFMKYRFKGISWNTFTLGSQLLLIDKKSVYREKMTSDSEDLITLILINNICYSKSKNKKNQRDQKVSGWNHGWKTETTKVYVITYFQNFC